MDSQPPARREELYIREANLTFFLHDRFLPALEDANRASEASEISETFFSGALLESFFWLRLGVEIGYFPLPLSRRLLYEYFPPILKAYERVLASKNAETWFDIDARSILDRELTGRTPPLSATSESDATGARPSLHPLFQSAFALANGFAQDSGAVRFTLALALASDQQWDRSIFENRPLMVSGAPESESDSLERQTNWAYSGFFKSVEYMHAFRQIRADHSDASPDGSPAEFARQLNELQRWRLNFGYPIYRQRFQGLATRTVKELAEQIPTDWAYHREKAEGDFAAYLYGLMTDWGAPLAAASAAE